MKIEMWSDFTCPLCYIAKRKLEMALEKFSHQDEVIVEYKSFEVVPVTKKYKEESYYEFLARRMNMSVKETKCFVEKINNQATDVGLTFCFDTLKPTNTLNAHRVFKYAKKHGKGNEMAELLLEAHFTNSEHIGMIPTLKNLAKKLHLSEKAIENLFKTNEFILNVREDRELAKQLGAQGIPFFVFNEKYSLSGDHPVKVLSEVIEEVWKEKETTKKLLEKKKTKTTYCTGDECE